MSSMSLPRVGAVLSLLLLSAFAFPVEGQTPAFQITSTTESTFLIDASTKSIDITVKNNHATAVVGQVDFSFTPPVGVDPISITVASRAGWTTSGAVDTDSDARNDKISLSGGSIASGATEVFTLEFEITSGTADGTQVTLKVAGTNTAADPDVLVGSQNTVLDLQAAGFAFTDASAVTFAAETGAQDRFLVLEAPPAQGQTIVVGLASSDATVATVAPASLSFDRTNWRTAQKLTITAQSDDIDSANRGAAITASHANGASYASAAAKSLQVTVVDDDTAGIAFSHRNAAVADSETIVYEGGPADTFTIALSSKPGGTVVVKVAVSPADQVTLDKATLTFKATESDPEAWNKPQVVTLTAVDDNVAEVLAIAVSITASIDDPQSSADYQNVQDIVRPATVVDNEGAGFTITQTGGETLVSEAPGARTDTFSVVLNRQPHKSVVVKAVAAQVGQTTAEISLLPPQMIFSTSNWNVPQTFTVTAIDDQLPEPTEIATVAVSIDKATSSGEYHAVAAQSVTVSIMDDDEAGFVISQTGGTTVVSEDGTTDTVTVRLAKEPSSPVVVKVTSADVDEVTVSAPASGTLTFTSANWNVAQTVTLTGVNDDDADGNTLTDITFAVVPESSDPNWRPLAAQTVVAVNKDNEAVVMARPATVDVAEGESTTYGLSLTIKPVNDVTVTITAGGGLTTDVKSVVFTPANWETTRTVTLTVPDDAVAEGTRTVKVQHAVLGSANYQGAPGETLMVTVTDDDTIDIAAVNKAVQDTVKVTRSDNRNTVTWDIGVADGAPSGVQIWRGDSPFFIVANADNGTAAYKLSKYSDEGGSSTSRYVVTVFYGTDVEKGFHTRGQATLDEVAGYLGQSESALESVGESVPEEDDNTLLIAGTVIGLLVVVAIIVVVVILARRKKDEGDWEGDWDQAAAEDPKDAPWKAAGWQVEPDRPAAPAAGQDTWSDEPEDAGWDADAAHEEYAWPEHEDDPMETFHLTCPQCSHDFSVQGHKPLETECPSCGVTGVLR